MSTAVVILNWNGRSLLEQFLPSVINNSKVATIYVADNASTDKSTAYVATNFPEVKIIQNKINGGYAKGYNDALKQVNEDIFCLLNSDVEVTKGWLKPIIKTFDNSPDTAIIQPKIIDYKQKTHFEYAGAAGGFIDQLGFPYCRGRVFNTVEADQNQYQTSTIFWASGACLFIRKSVFESLQGFDEHYFAHFEEIDLCWRAFNMGYKSSCVTQSIVYHVGGATLHASNPKKTYLNFRNSLFTLTKNASGPIFIIIFCRLILDGIAGIRFLVTFKFAHFLAILKAHFSFYHALPHYLNLRKTLPQKKKYYHSTSIVWTYFIRGKKHFSQF